MKVFKNFGLTDKNANEYVQQLFLGTANFSQYKKFSQINKMIASKGGTTEAALKTLKKNKFQKILEKAIVDAFKRAKSISKEK